MCSRSSFISTQEQMRGFIEGEVQLELKSRPRELLRKAKASTHNLKKNCCDEEIIKKIQRCYTKFTLQLYIQSQTILKYQNKEMIIFCLKQESIT